MKKMRSSTLETIGLGSVLNIFKRGEMPANIESLVEKVFGPEGDRGALVISGANGIVGAGKMMQLGSRLVPYGVTMVGLDFPSAPDGIGQQYAGLKATFGPHADEIMTEVVQFNYDGKSLPSRLKELRPRFLLEALSPALRFVLSLPVFQAPNLVSASHIPPSLIR
jgi:hypothetical protein